MSTVRKVKDEKVYELYERISKRIDDLKAMLEEKKESALRNLDSYISLIVEQCQAQGKSELDLVDEPDSEESQVEIVDVPERSEEGDLPVDQQFPSECKKPISLEELLRDELSTLE